MICVVDASVAVKWFAEGDWALREGDIEPALELLKASTRGTMDFYQPPHFLAEVAAVVSRLNPDRAQQYCDNLAQLNITWAAPTVAYARAIELARQEPTAPRRGKACRTGGGQAGEPVQWLWHMLPSALPR